jgi:hypothetical protein
MRLVRFGSNEMTQQDKPDWGKAEDVYNEFCVEHPELYMTQGKWAFHNFLRYAKDYLVRQDAIRKAKGKHWIACRSRFSVAAFDAVTIHYENKSDLTEQDE